MKFKLDHILLFTILAILLGLSSCSRSKNCGDFDLPPSLTCTGNPSWLSQAISSHQHQPKPFFERKNDLEEESEGRRCDLEYERLGTPLNELRDLSQPIERFYDAHNEQQFPPPPPPVLDPIRRDYDGDGNNVSVFVENNQSVDLDEENEPLLPPIKSKPLSRIEKLYNKSQGQTNEKYLRQFGYDSFNLHNAFLPEVRLPQYGQETDLVMSQTQAMRTALGGPVNGDYIMGPGDEVLIQTTGGVEINGSFTIEREGTIFLPQVGVIKLANYRANILYDLIYEALAERYKDFILEASLGKLHSIRIMIVGQVDKPGMQYVAANVTLFEAIGLAGGPKKDGSLRDVVLRRKGQPEQHIDLYPLLIGGDQLDDIALIEGDSIAVMPIGPTAAIEGPVISGIFELSGKTSLSELVSYAGGINAFTELNTVLVERTTKNGFRELLKVDFMEEAGSFSIHDGDFVDLKKVIGDLQNIVAIEGLTVRPGTFTYEKGMVVSDLLKLGQGFLLEASLEKALLQRRNTSPKSYSLTGWDERAMVRDEVIWVNLKEILEGKSEADIPLERLDTLKILSLEEVEELPTVSIRGAVRFPGIYHLTKNMTLYDLVMLAGGPSDNAYRGVSSIVRREEHKCHNDVKLLPFCLNSVVFRNGDDNVLLKNYDEIVIRQAQDLQVTATIEGHVQFPGTYVLPYGSRLSDLFIAAGGLLPEAELRGAVFTRDSVRNLQYRRLEELFARTKELHLHKRNVVTRDGHMNESLANQLALTGLQVLDRNMSRFQTQGRVVVDLLGPDFVCTENNMLLENNDVLYIPQRNNAVAVLGRVFSPNAFVWKPWNTIADYIMNAGGFTEEANPCQVYVVMANGIVRSTRQLGYERMMAFSPGPGDAVLIPAKELGRSKRAILEDNVMILREMLEMGLIGATIPQATKRDAIINVDMGYDSFGQRVKAEQLYDGLVERALID